MRGLILRPLLFAGDVPLEGGLIGRIAVADRAGQAEHAPDFDGGGETGGGVGFDFRLRLGLFPLRGLLGESPGSFLRPRLSLFAIFLTPFLGHREFVHLSEQKL